jgi:hypothetical protein
MVNVTGEKRKVLAGTDLAQCETVSFVVCPLKTSSGTLRVYSTKYLVDEDQRKKVFNLLCENATVFSSNSSDLGLIS